MLWRWLLLMLCLSGVAQALEVSAEFKQHQSLTYQYTFSQADTIQALLASDPQWQSGQRQALKPPANTQAWLRVSLHNPGPIEVPLLLSIDNNLLDKITAYIRHDDASFLTLALGDALPLLQRPIKHEAQLIPLELPAHSDSQVYLQVSHHGTLNAPLSLWHPIEYLKYKSKFNLVYGILAGFILAMIAINFTLYSFTRRRYFLHGTLIIGLFWLLIVHLYGFGYRYLYGSSVWLQQYGQSLLVMCSTLALIPIQRSKALPNLLAAKHNRKLTQLLIAGLTLTLLSLLLPVTQATFAAYSMALTLVLGYIICTVRSRYRRTTKATALLIYVIMLVTLSYQFGFELGVFGGAQLDRPVTYVCYLILSLYISFVLTRQFILEREKHVKTQQHKLARTQAEDALLKEKLKLQEQAQQELENSIDERTFELQVTLRELEEKNHELEKLNMEDPMTKVKNRRYFDKRLMMEVRRSRREQTTLSLIMLDIDFFKKVNDNYGHLAGDHTICAFARLIEQHLKRPLDEVFRYGGEEFVILLPNTSEDGALELAEQIRQETEAHELKVAGHQIKFTTSAGVYSAIAQDTSNPTLFTDMADKGLYMAKQQGRNRICIYQPKQET
ncbi:diguanylate cyclase [Pseudoalteromonas viridis]|uniref:diguanylate cyclase n=1 Tax=Pseudoalteromonas viridis TaxID=339617 RepID=A0ABX7V654_9GAMM|nr:diguanylate cyclase [Pseudoalteromonas viridis]QTL36371.1 diguanylate cyclase [Pseudoalteromonas viridis]